MTGFQRLSIATVLSTYALLIIGGIVRVTESGLGCPDWPLCDGKVIPAARFEVLIEYTHRAVAAIVGILVVSMAVMAWRRYRHVPAVIVPMALALAVLLAQIILGGVTVLNDLPSSIVMAHLGTGLALLALLLIATIFSFTEGRMPIPTSFPLRGFPGLAAFAALATLTVMLVGAYVSGSDASLACDDWPLCNGEVIPGGGREVGIQFLHRVLVVGLGLVILAVTVQAWRNQRHSRPLMMASAAALGLYGVQVLVGAGNIWSKLEPSVTAAHLAVGAALWSVLIALTVLSYFWAKPVPSREPLRKAASDARGLTT
jgi:heme A synthase